MLIKDSYFGTVVFTFSALLLRRSDLDPILNATRLLTIVVHPFQDTIKEEDERPKPPSGSSIPPRKRKTSAPTRFCFFDYSMIPDKDPR